MIRCWGCAEQQWRSHQNSLRQSAGGFYWLEEGATGYGCFRGGRRRGRETEKDCQRREIREELPKLKLGRLKLWKEVKAKNPRSGRKMSDAVFIANKVSGRLVIGDRREIDKATWRKPRGIRLTPTSRYIRDKLFPKRG